MSVVVDASAVALWFIRDPRTQAARSILSGDLCAPDILLAEVGNALWLALRKSGEHTAVRNARRFLQQVPHHVRISPSGGLIESAFDIARSIDHSIYDSLYVALAVRESAVLATFDERLIAKLRESNYAHVLS